MCGGGACARYAFVMDSIAQWLRILRHVWEQAPADPEAARRVR